MKKPRKCYLMIEDIEGTTDEDVQFQFAFLLGLDEGEEPPKTVEDMTPAQEATWNMFNVLQSVVDQQKRQAIAAEMKSQIVVPEHLARKH